MVDGRSSVSLLRSDGNGGPARTYVQINLTALKLTVTLVAALLGVAVASWQIADRIVPPIARTVVEQELSNEHSWNEREHARVEQDARAARLAHEVQSERNQQQTLDELRYLRTRIDQLVDRTSGTTR